MKPIYTKIRTVSISLIFILLIAIVLRVDKIEENLMDNVVQIYEILIHLFIIYNVYKIYSETKKRDRTIIIWFLITNIFFLINDCSFYIGIFLKASTTSQLISTNYPQLNLWANNAPFFAWLICIIICLYLMLTRYVIKPKIFYKIFILLLLIDIVVMSYYWKPINFHSLVISSLHIGFLIFTSVIELIILELFILCLIYTRNNFVLLFSSGFIIVISGDLLITYGRLAQIENLFTYGGSLWCLGLILILWGTSGIIKQNSYNIKSWFNANNNVKSLISSWTLSISIGTLLIFFSLANVLNILDKNALIILPLVLILYSLIIVILTMYMSNVLENPFREIETNVQNLLKHNKLSFNNTFKIKEFEKLQEFFMRSFEQKEQQDLLRKKLGDMVGQAAHDLGSPIKALQVAIKKLKEKGIDTETLNLDLSVSRLHEYQSSILSYYRNIPMSELSYDYAHDSENEEKWILINYHIISITNFKILEWENNPCTIELDIPDNCHSLWVKLDLHQFERILSNLLNNAYESFSEDNINKKIKVQILYINSILTIQIIDTGCGMSDTLVKQVIKGKSTKHSGKGMGVSTSFNYLKKINGDLYIDSHINFGTSVAIVLPIITTPDWQFDSIRYSNNSVFIIIDDEINVLKQWQTLAIIKRINILLFSKVDDYYNWFSELQDYEPYILISDYDLQHKTTGLDIIKQAPFNQKYLVSGLAESDWLQTICATDNIKLTHKILLNYIQLIQL